MARKAKTEPLPYYKWLWRDWRSNRKVQRMSWQAKGLYRELLDEFWSEGILPAEHTALADICGCSLDEFEHFWPEIEASWEPTPEGLVNRKMDEQRTDTDTLRAANARNGKAGAIAKLASAGEVQRPLASVDDRQATASARHIAEQSRAEHKQSREIPLPDASRAGDGEKHPDLLIYEQFPRKEGRRKALEAIAKAVARLAKGEEPRAPCAPLEARRFLYSMVTCYARSPAGANPDITKVPHPATWFSQSRYLDDIKTWQHVTGESNGTFGSTKDRKHLDGAQQALAIIAEREAGGYYEDAGEVGGSSAGGAGHGRLLGTG